MLLALYYMVDVICGKEEQRQAEEDTDGEDRPAAPDIEVVSQNSSCDDSPSSSLQLADRLKAEDTTRLR